LVRREAKNFYWGFISLAHDQRIAIYALYGFARQIDDEADDPTIPRLPERLTPHRARVSRCVRGDYDADDPVMHVLSHAIPRYGIQEQELQMLIDGVEMDFSRTRYQTWDDLREYCRRVASVVGRMCVRIFGYSDPRALDCADELGLGLQVINILRDVREDVSLGRIYLPQDELAQFGVSENDIFAGAPSLAWRSFIDFQARRARALVESGYDVLRYIPRRPRACVKTMAGIYERLLDKIELEPDLPLRERASLSNSEKLQVMLQAWLGVA
jgi:phytoene synthase